MTSIPEDWTYETPVASGITSSSRAYYTETSQTQKKETERRHLREKWDRVSREVIAMELKMGVNQWTVDSPEYKSTLQYITERDYQVALQKLHGLMVQRLFELHTMNISQTGRHRMPMNVSGAMLSSSIQHTRFAHTLRRTCSVTPKRSARLSDSTTPLRKVSIRRAPYSTGQR